MAERKARALPEGWRIEGLWTGIAAGNPDYREVDNRTVSDAEIGSAERIVVSYKSRKTGVVDHRTIHGAANRAQLGAIIRYTTRRISPVGRRSR